ncbi:hypothetical protein JXR93_05290 [bacterium]|nr:hypothetical protein [bacterium]
MKRYGVDIGTTFLTVYSNEKERVVQRVRHEGKISEWAEEFISQLDDEEQVFFTGKGGLDFSKHTNIPFAEESAVLSEAIKNISLFKNRDGKIMDIGASSLTLYQIRDGKISDISENSLCAAGTGLFLEEQAERLKLSDEESIRETSITTPPLIATRCTVFAKSDLIHHQQEGRTKEEVWSGLCKSLSVSAVNTLFKGEEVQGDVFLIGGVTKNEEVLKWLRNNYPEANWIIDKDSSVFIAKGASFFEGCSKKHISLVEGINNSFLDRMPPLKLLKSVYPEFKTPDIDRFGNEVRVHKKIEKNQKILLGMDIGSTSTKLAAIDSETKEPLFDLYRKTAGEPIKAASDVFFGVQDILLGLDIEISAFGTTGSGRKMVGEIFHADFIVNEITAHGTATGYFYPEVETIFEIGGQDAKYIRLKNGNVADVNMNYVCAAGTGSFVEEQVRKLGFSLFEVGDITENIAPPITSDRCTVFMEQDLRAILKKGFQKEEALSSVLYSVIKNYLNRVVGNRPISKDKIFFQGATARNIGLVAAIENLLDREVIVSPFCHVMGGIGAAIIAGERNIGKKSKFNIEKSMNIEFVASTEICKLCTNYCRINHIIVNGGEKLSWGYQCGRESGSTKRKEIPQYQSFENRESLFFDFKKAEKEYKGVIRVVHSLTDYTYLPLWNHFFDSLGYKTVLSAKNTTKNIKNKASRHSSEDYCFPVKASLGHAIVANENGEFVFHPHYIAEKKDNKTAISFFCPYVESAPSVIRSVLRRNSIDDTNYITPIVDFRWEDNQIAEVLFDDLKKVLNITKKETIAAYKAARVYWQKKFELIKLDGERELNRLTELDEPFFVFIGRPYNIFDKGINMGIPEIVAKMGYNIIPMDVLALNTEELSDGNYFNVFWSYGQKIVAALKRIKNIKNAYPIYLSNFNCGPDSFILNFAEDEFREKPLLILELDEHDNSGGYQTRIEAFIDVVSQDFKIKNRKQLEKSTLPDIYTFDKSPDLSTGTLWFPQMHPGARFFAAAFRGGGYKAEALDLEDISTLQTGKKELRGGECLPMTLTLGSILQKLEEKKDEKHILFMPTSEGPCRLGQYNLLERIVFHQKDIKNVDILSLSSINSYQGVGEKLRRAMMHAMMTSDIMLKFVTKTRPYEINKGDAEAEYEYSSKLLERAFEKKESPKDLMKEIAKRFSKIPKRVEKRALVGIVGEIYARCNSFANGDLIKVIEDNGGEAWLAPMHEWILYTANIQSHRAKFHKFSFIESGESLIKNLYLFKTESSYYKEVKSVLHDREEPDIKQVVEEGAKYVPKDFVGEAILTIGRAIMFQKQGASMIVNVSPFGCMHGIITSSIFKEIKEKLNIPIISQFYEGELDINQRVASLLNLKQF